MSVLLYEGVNLVDPLNPASTDNKGAEVTATFAVMKGNNRVHGSSVFAVCASSWGAVVAKAYALAEEIESLSRGVLVKLELKVGKYIKDVSLQEITDKQKTLMALYKNLDGSKSTKIRIPFVRTDVADDVIESVLQGFDPCLLLKNPAGTGVLLFDTNRLQSTATYKWDKEPAGVVSSGNVPDAGADGMVGQSSATPVLP